MRRARGFGIPCEVRQKLSFRRDEEVEQHGVVIANGVHEMNEEGVRVQPFNEGVQQ